VAPGDRGLGVDGWKNMNDTVITAMWDQVFKVIWLRIRFVGAVLCYGGEEGCGEPVSTWTWPIFRT